MKKIVAILIASMISGLLLFATGNAIAQSANPDIKINEIMFIPGPGNDEWVEIYNTGTTSVDIDNYELTDEDNNVYTIPIALPDVPASCFVVVIFDGEGSGSDDYDFSDNKAVLHTPSGLTDVFEDSGDQCSLYTGSTHNSTTIVDFVAWGVDAKEDDDNAVAAGIWSPETFTSPSQKKPGASILLPGGSIGLYPGKDRNWFGDWVIYLKTETTPGSENHAPSPFFSSPPYGAWTTDHYITFDWSYVANAERYHLQVGDDPLFGSPEIDIEVQNTQFTPTTPLLDGTHFFHVKVISIDGRESCYSETSNITIFTAGGSLQNKDLKITPILQHKDTRMLCLDGCNEIGDHAWDREHKNTNCPHCAKYCTRASIAMVASYFDGDLSQDLISYYAYGQGDPEGDLGHGKGLWPNEPRFPDEAHGDVLSWALKGAAVTRVDIKTEGKPAFNNPGGNGIVQWIDANRPIIVVEQDGGHTVVIDGYTMTGTLVHRIDPGTATEAPIVWNTYDLSGDCRVYVPPAGSKARSDVEEADWDEDNEADTVTDTGDGDGICDFDEIYRFPTKFDDKDSDNDCVEDKPDMREYVFDNAGDYNYRNPDIDNDNKRKEVDPDNDHKNDDGAVDGAEDKNRNGKYEPALAETDNFDKDDDNNAPGQETKDFGDAPDPTYPSLLASNGARHSVFAFEWLGKDVNGEHDSNQVAADKFDDGVTFVGTPKLGSPFRVIVRVNTSGLGAARYGADDKLYLNAWIDWNVNGEWESFEKIIEWNGGPGLNDVCTKGKLVKPTIPWPVGNNSRVLEFDVTVPVTTILEGMIGKPYYSRFRLDYDENVNTTTGPAKFGEVEDHDLVEGEWRAKWPTVLWYVQKGTKYSIEIFLNKTGYVTRVDFERLGCPVTEIPVELAEQSLAKLPPGFAIELPGMVTETMYKNSITQPVDVSEIPKMFTVYP